jgi:hypothetical protein
MNKIKPIVVDMRKLKDKAFDEIRKAKGKKQDQAIEDLAVFLAVVEASGGKKDVPVTEKQIQARYKELYFQVLCEFMVRQGALEATYDSKGRIASMKSTPKGLTDAEKIISKAKSRALVAS